MRLSPSRPRGPSLLLSLAVLLTATACASAEKRMDQGVRLEQEGRAAEAALRYVDALKKDPSLGDARVRLRETGAEAVARSLRDASLLDAAGRADEAADALSAAEELHLRAGEVGVELALPPDFAQRRRALFDRAIEASLVAAADLARAERWDEADRRLARATESYLPAPAQLQSLAKARVDATLAAAESEMARGSFRAAYERAERVRQSAGAGSSPDALAPLLRLRDEALRRGTQRVAVLPVTIGSAARDRLPEEFALALSDEMETHWGTPPLFVEVVEPARTRGSWRRRGYGRGAVTPAEAAELGRDVGAALVVIARVDSVARWQSDVERTRRAVRTTAGTDTAYTVVAGRERLRVQVRYALVDPRWGRVVDEGTSTAETGARFRRGEFAGDWRTLALSRDDRTLFTSQAGALERELSHEIVERLAPQLTREVYARVERQVQ